MEHFTPSLLVLSLLFISVVVSFSTSDDLQTYIIHMDKSAMPAPFSDHHSSTLSSISSTRGISPAHLYTYNHVIDGFSAILSRSHLEWLEKMPGHLATYPETFGHLHTTHTPKFLGLKKHSGLWPVAGFGDDMIIGILDTGIWPESESFKDDEMPLVPARWHGTCETGTEFNSSHCNRKLIGARSFREGMKRAGLNISKTDDYDSPRDYMGHGTPTSSTAAGSRVPYADYFGYAKGTATGISPKARLAMYKVIFFDDTNSYDAAASDTLAGMDQAIADGVDLMLLSLGFFEKPFYENPIALGAFAAMERGIFVECSAGNGGPHAYKILNGAPWITTIGAGTVDRDFAAQVSLGDGVLTVIGKTRAAGAIFSSDDGQFLWPSDFDMPFVTVKPKDGDMVKDYLIKSDNATVSIQFQITLLDTKPAPQVAYFSSRGPDQAAPWILKPDLLAPGVNILAAWVPNKEAAPIRDNYLLTDYALVSGTSMASPHAVGIAALLKAAHRDWSSAAIRSAMMTTADVFDNTNGPIVDMTTGIAGTPLDFGGRHVNPNKAMDRGLVYDIEVEDYISYLCGLNYTREQIKVISRRNEFSCDKANLDLNYPSFIVMLNNTNTTSYTFKRVLTNVADSSSVYHAVVRAPLGMNVTVRPATISFPKKYSTAEFNLTVEIDLGHSPQSYYIGNYGYLSWYEINGKHVVRSPVVSAIAR
ncbi:hypothetical protein F0562_020686 [Nyssa sinensis]|uniref:Subtilisin-like protease fibronectin type-III domain-containing protein n=1 Tax=Nyssa sinensis TaxID=561372 RepID=A0A5J5BRW9_9ASTE|nr:hypothetical protein F0562_020686 [Nyssa sinensis]